MLVNLTLVDTVLCRPDLSSTSDRMPPSTLDPSAVAKAVQAEIERQQSGVVYSELSAAELKDVIQHLESRLDMCKEALAEKEDGGPLAKDGGGAGAKQEGGSGVRGASCCGSGKSCCSVRASTAPALTAPIVRTALPRHGSSRAHHRAHPHALAHDGR